MRGRSKLMRGVVLVAMLGLLAGAIGSTPGIALTGKDKKQVRKIAKKVVNKALSNQTGGCPTGTDRYGEGCIEENARTNAQWFAASKTCGDANRRMATLAELNGYRQVSGVTLPGYEWSSDVDVDGGILKGHRMNDAGNYDFLDATSLSQYRCVAPLS